jgi:type VI secretion system protein ImpH
MPDAGLSAEVTPGAAYAPPAVDAAREVAPEVAAAEAADADARRQLLRALRDEPTSFTFAQAVRLLTRLRPERAPLGGWADPADEVVRFAVHPSLGFPPSELQALELPPPLLRESGEGGAAPAPDPNAGRPIVPGSTARMQGFAVDRPARMTVNHFGLTGPQGVLPHAYTEHAAARARARDTAFRDFLDLFHHRALSLHYRAWARARFAVAQEARDEDRLHDHLLDLAGFGTEAVRERSPIPASALAFYAGLLGGRVRHADGLARLVGDYFDVPTAVEQFAGAWRRVDAGGQLTLDAPNDAGRLGFGVLGDAAWDAEARVTLRVGPLTRAQFDAFLPGGDAHAALAALVRLYADEQVGVDAQLVLLRGAVGGCTLGAPADAAAPAAGAPPRLGRGSWLTSRPMTRDPDDTVFALC